MWHVSSRSGVATLRTAIHLLLLLLLTYLLTNLHAQNIGEIWMYDSKDMRADRQTRSPQKNTPLPNSLNLVCFNYTFCRQLCDKNERRKQKLMHLFVQQQQEVGDVSFSERLDQRRQMQ